MSVVSLSETPFVLAQKAQRNPGCLFYIQRGLKALVILIAALALLGLVYQSAAEASDREAYPPPGQMIVVNGHRMHIQCASVGSPTVILEAGAGHFSALWAWVQPAVAQSTRVCTYDRAGYGWSEPGPEPRDAQRIAAELHELLKLADVEPPYVMVGHSLGGVYVRVYNAQYPGEVVGMALIDATHPDNWTRQGESFEAVQTLASISSALSRIGLMRLFFAGQQFNLPEPNGAILKANISSVQYWDTQRADTAAGLATLAQGRAAGNLGSLPLAVLTAVDYPEGRGRETELALQTELAALSSNSVHETVEGAHHITLVTDAQYALSVSDMILRVVEAARTGTPLTK
jgi:pimeloyl-ACP methyl ester carboxylesterase